MPRCGPPGLPGGRPASSGAGRSAAVRAAAPRLYTIRGSYTQFRAELYTIPLSYTQFARPPGGAGGGVGRAGALPAGHRKRSVPRRPRRTTGRCPWAVSVGGVRGRCIRRRTRGRRRGRAPQGVAVADAEAHPVAPVAGAVVAEGGEDAGEGTGGEAVAEAGLEGAAFGLRADRPPSAGRRRRRSPGRTGRSAPPRRRGRRTTAREDGAVRTGGFPGNPGGGRVRFRRRRSVPRRTPGRRRGPGSAGRRSGRPPAPGSGRRRRRSRRRG